jgi:sterol desaturase/sphingolipid hydroxylase (fatty acid hydroxylase superfamily)
LLPETNAAQFSDPKPMLEHVAELLRELAEILEGTAIEVALGLAIGLLALAIPFRRFATRPRLAADIAAAIAVTIFAIVVESMLDVPVDFATARLGDWYESIGNVSWWILIPAYIVLADFGAYWAHRALHTRWLWPTHAWHHSPKHLYWLSGLRGSPIHLLVLFAPYYVAFLIFPTPDAAIVSGAILVLDVSNQHYIHSNLKLPCARQLEWLFVTPRFHFVHHSAELSVANRNYGFIFSVWDRLFGTYLDPARVPLDDPLGLSYEISGWRLVLGLPPRTSREL